MSKRILSVVALLLSLATLRAEEAAPIDWRPAVQANFANQAIGAQPLVERPRAGRIGRAPSRLETYKHATISVENRREFGGAALFFDDHISNLTDVAHTRSAAWFGVATPATERVRLRFRFMFLRDPRNCYFTAQGLSRAQVLTVMARADGRLVVRASNDGADASIVHPETLTPGAPSMIELELALRERLWTLTVNGTPLAGKLPPEAANSFYEMLIAATHGGTVQFAVDDVSLELPAADFRADAVATGEERWRAATAAEGMTLETGAQMPSPATRWEFSATNFALTSINVAGAGTNLLRHPGGVFLRDGESGGVLVPQHEQIGRAASLLNVTHDYADALRATTTIQAEGDMIRWRTVLDNAATNNRHIELVLALPCALKSQSSYFDGHTTHAIGVGEIWRAQLEQTLPVSFLYHAGETGVAFGIPPDSDTSILQNGITAGVARYLTRLVVSPGRPVAFDFILFTADSRFGFRDAMQGYVQRFPEAFRPFPGVDPRLSGGRRADAKQQNHYWGGAVDATQAIASASTHGGVEWAYAISKRGGDLYGHPEYWDFAEPPAILAKMTNRFKASGYLLNFFDCPSYHEGKRTMWTRANYRGNVALTHFMIDFVEEGLAKQFDLLKCAYPDNDEVPALRSTWGFEYCSRLYHVYPWANAYETFMRRDIPLLVKELNLPGMAHDMFNESPSAPLYRGPLDRYLPGWSYDAQGPCLSRLLGYRKIPELCHTLTNADGHAVGVLANGIILATPLSFAYPDCWLTETRPTRQLLERVGSANNWGRENYKLARFFAGSKPVYQHAGIGNELGDLVDWEALTPDQIGLLVDDFYKDEVTWYYQAGVLPASIYVACVAAVRQELPWLYDVLSRGFQPVPLFSGDAALERVRYGAGGQSAVVLSSRAPQPAIFHETIHNAYLGSGYAIPLNLKGGTQSFAMTQGQTLLDVAIDPLENRILTLNVALALPDGIAAQGRSQTIMTPTERGYRIVVTLPSELAASWTITADPGFVVTSITCNGASAAPGAIRLHAGDNTLHVVTTSLDHRAPFAEFAAFPYERAAIVLDDPASQRQAAAALNWQDFLHVRLGVSPALVDQRPATDTTILIGTRTDDGRTGVWVEGEALVIRGANDFDAQQRAWSFMRFLEENDPRFQVALQPIVAGTRESRAMLAKGGLLDKPMARLDRAGLTRFPWQAQLRADLLPRP